MFRFFPLTLNRVSDVSRQLEQAAKAMHPVILQSLNQTSFKARQEVNNNASQVFQNPTHLIRNAAFVKPAKQAEPFTVVHIKQQPFNGGTHSPADVLLPHVEGGKRLSKGLEMGLRARQLLGRLQGKGIPRNTHFVPGAGAELNKFGNLTPAKVKRILNETKRPGGKFFMWIPDGSRYPLVMHQKSKQAAPEIALVGVAPPQYKKRFAFHAIVEQTFAKHYTSTVHQRLDALLPDQKRNSPR